MVSLEGWEKVKGRRVWLCPSRTYDNCVYESAEWTITKVTEFKWELELLPVTVARV